MQNFFRGFTPRASKRVPCHLGSTRGPQQEEELYWRNCSPAPPKSVKEAPWPLGLQKGPPIRRGAALEEHFLSRPPRASNGPLAAWAPKGAPNKKGNCIGGALSQAPPQSVKEASWPPGLQKELPIRRGIVLGEPFRRLRPQAWGQVQGPELEAQQPNPLVFKK